MGHAQRLGPEQRLDRRFRRHEARGAGGVEDVLLCAVSPFRVVAVDQCARRFALHTAASFQPRLSDVLYPAIAAPRAERRNHMRAVAHEDHATMHEALQHHAAEAIDREPVHPERLVPHDGANARQDAVLGDLGIGIGIRVELQVDAVDVVGLLVQERGLCRDGRADRTRTTAPACRGRRRGYPPSRYRR
jgi:hypothetical protein